MSDFDSAHIRRHTPLRRFWALAIKAASPESQRHFVESFIDYLESVVSQAADRDNDTFRTVDTYLENRRENVGARPSFVPFELHLRLPDHVFNHPIIRELQYHTCDLLVLDNVSFYRPAMDKVFTLSLKDIASYNKEQATGDDRHNIITVVMHQFDLDIAGAMEWTANLHKAIEAKFFDALTRVPSWGKDIDEQVVEYIYGLGNWPRGNDCWNFESGRYFGSKGPEYQKTRLVPLLPKRRQDAGLHRENVIIPLVDALYKL